MTVPTYSRIDDTEIDPESALTTTLFHKLRDNCLALLGADGASSSPTITLPGQNLYINFIAGTYNFTVPDGIGTIQFEAWGPGGASQGSFGPANTSVIVLGGSGETRIGTLSVTPLETLTIEISSGQNSITSTRPTSTKIKRGSTVLVEAIGGQSITVNAPATGGTGGTGIDGTDMVSTSSLPNDTWKIPCNASSFGSCPSGPGGTQKKAVGLSNGEAGGVRIRY